MKKHRLMVTVAEWKYIIKALNALRNRLISEGQYTDTVDDTLITVMNAKTKRVKVAG